MKSQFNIESNIVKGLSLELTTAESLLILKGLTSIEQDENYHDSDRKHAREMHDQIMSGLKHEVVIGG